MSNGIIVHLDDDAKKILGPSKEYFDQTHIDMELIQCQNEKEFLDIVSERMSDVRVLIFDLLSSDTDRELLKPEEAHFLTHIKDSFAKYNVPIFIYSGYIMEEIISQFKEYGNVYIVDKAQHGFDYITNKIELFLESGFLEVFSPDGIIDKIKADLHRTFISQFKSNKELESTIQLIIDNSDGQHKDRTKTVFTRIAIRTLLHEMISPSFDGENPSEKKLALTEHYIRRINNEIVVFTGDIFVSNTNPKDVMIILTPRCNIMRTTEYLVCPIDLNDFPKKTVGGDAKKKIGLAAQGDPKYSGYNRHLPPSPIFSGGQILIAKYKIIKKAEIDNYHREVSLSDELTNEILGKFGAYFFRTGITPWDQSEMIAHLQQN
ncbi:hypothetical protein [uncultured Draconibacterium sp.]|uniref:hypothetical protein n=1 Tax=uncultured Draconibacterium sp. TaxID=1573823 RepID=UPI00321685B4